MTKPRRWLYTVCWGSALLGMLSFWRALPELLRFILWAASVLFNGPGCLVVANWKGYVFLRTVAGRLLSALAMTLLSEPLLRWLEQPLHESELEPAQAQAQVTRRMLLLGGSAASGVLATGGYSYLWERRRFEVTHHRVGLPDLPKQLEGLRVVVLADFHCGPVNRPGDLRPAILLANQCRPDLVLLPGDFVHLSSRYFSEAAELMSLLEPRIPGGLLVSWGNHDHWNELEHGVAEFTRAGWTILKDNHRVLSPRRDWSPSGPGLVLAGVDDLWEGTPDLTAALRGAPPDQPRLVLAHNPDCAEEMEAERVDLMISGHTHGGQIRIPGLGTPVVPSRYGQKYASGLVMGPHYPVYVTRGLGVGGIPIRLGVRPEVTLFELYRSDQGFQCFPQSGPGAIAHINWG